MDLVRHGPQEPIVSTYRCSGKFEHERAVVAWCSLDDAD